MRIFSTLAILAFALSLAGCGPLNPLAPGISTSETSGTNATKQSKSSKPFKPSESSMAMEKRVFELTNAERAKHRLPPLIWHDVLSSAARAHSDDMLRNNMTGHSGSDGSSAKQRIERQGIKNANSWSENVAYGSSTPEAVVQAWMNSPGHKANILSNNSSHLGVGLVLRPAGSNAAYSHYWTQNFVRLPK